MGNSWGSYNWANWRVVDEGGGGSKNFGGTSKNSRVSISRSLSKVVAITESMISNSDWNCMGFDFSSNLGRSFNNTFNNRYMGNSMSSSQWSYRESSVGKASISKSPIQKSRIGFRVSTGQNSQRSDEKFADHVNVFHTTTGPVYRESSVGKASIS